MPKDRYLQSASNYAEMGRSNENFIADSNKRFMADLRVRTEAWGKSIFDLARNEGIPGFEVLADQAYFEIPGREFLETQVRSGNFPWWQTHYVVGPFNSVQIAFDEKVNRVGIYSTFRAGAYLTFDLGDDDVKFRASSFRKKGNRNDAAVWRDLGAFDPGEEFTAYNLFIDKRPFERVEYSLEVLDWINDLVDLRRNPREEKKTS